ncbi:hypothetical protein scyTo_0024469 [Scyliorhinus torazame]|uniref:Uncharacterized protein n=1 Tax=Scyliorhinus torazame TaxID=75743 RepID=A0A401QDK3_SCYTO|nr:hypothetical protein [Scyliorhinus torazame]
MPRLKGSQDAVSRRGRAGQKRECRWDYTEGGGRRESKPTTSRGSSRCCAEEGLRSHPGLVNGADLDLTRRSASDSESHSRRRKRKREELQPRARSEVGHRPVRGGPNGSRPSQPELPFGNHRGTVRHRHRDRGDPGPTGGPQRERRSHLEIGQRANRLHQPLHPTERPNQEEGPNKDGGHHRPLAAEEKKQQAPHPLAVGGQQARQPLAGGQQQAPRPLAVGEGPAHYPLPTKVKVKQVHFLLENEEKMKPAHWPETSKQKQVQPPLELKGKEMCWALTSKQTHVRPPLAAGERGKQPQIPLAPQGRDAQSSLAGRQRKILSGVPLAAQGTLIQYRLGSKDTDTIIDYLTDKRKGKSPAPPPHLRTSPAGFRGARSPEPGAGRPAHAGSNHRKLLLSLPPADSREEREPPPGRCAGDGAAWNPGGDWPEPVPARPGGFCWRDEPAPRAAEVRRNSFFASSFHPPRARFNAGLTLGRSRPGNKVLGIPISKIIPWSGISVVP